MKRTLTIISYLRPRYFCIENPMGLLRHQQCMARLIRYRKTVSYCKYGYTYRKNTDLWTNVDFCARRCKKGSYCEHKQKHGSHEMHCQSGQRYIKRMPQIAVSQMAHGCSHVVSLNERYSIPPILLAAILRTTLRNEKPNL